MRRLALPLVLLTAFLSCALAAASGVSQLVSYVSDLDQSVQQYGVYLPDTPLDMRAGHPAVFHMHGYGWSVSAGFSDSQKRWADEHGWIIINLNARGPQFYEGVGDVETRNVIRDADRRFGLDLTRLYVTGGSMGGTGAFRMGIRYPDLFAAAVGVDGWSDYREWHYHWYARTDQHNDIEEFRRPLLEAASPLYWAGRARWNAVQASVSGQDNVVLPDNGLLLYNALLERSAQTPGTYANRLFLDYNAGHGGSYREADIYNYFLNRQTHSNPPDFVCESPLLTHGRMYWGSMLRLKVQGAGAGLESVVDMPDPATAAPGDRRVPSALVTVATRNLSEAALHLQSSPAAAAADVAVYVDGFLAYQGPPRTVNLRADFSPRGDLWGWQEVQPSGRRKTPEMEGPIGEAYKHPFMVAYGTAGTPAEVARNRREAEAFARGWNDFMVHAQALVAQPEEQISRADLQSRSLVLYGTEHSSRLLREANARRELPVHILSDRVVIRDPQWGDRTYYGDKFGAYVCVPNPLADDQQYLVVGRGQWSTKPDGSNWQGLEYDLEKLPWAYPDYFVFNSNLSELPHVLNVNNKPPVTCYEAGYFVEAGYFDQDWRPYRAATLDRVKALRLPTRLIHVDDMRRTGDGLQVLVADGGGAPVPQARVTVTTSDTTPASYSGLTDADGIATFAAVGARVPCQVLGLMATGAEWDWPADRANSTEQQGVTLVARADGPDELGRVKVSLDLGSDHAERLTVRLVTPVGQVDQPLREIALGAGERETLALQWCLPGVPLGVYRAAVEITARHRPAAFSRPLFVTVAAWSDSPLRLLETALADVTNGGCWQATAKLTNLGTAPETVRLRVSLPADRQYAVSPEVTIKPSEDATIVVPQPPDTRRLELGVHPARLVVEGQRGLTATGEFTVR